MPVYEKCLDAETHRPKIEAHRAEAERRQIQSTPTFVFNGTVVPSALPYDEFKKYVDKAAAAVPPAAGPVAAPPAKP